MYFFREKIRRKFVQLLEKESPDTKLFIKLNPNVLRICNETLPILVKRHLNKNNYSVSLLAPPCGYSSNDPFIKHKLLDRMIQQIYIDNDIKVPCRSDRLKVRNAVLDYCNGFYSKLFCQLFEHIYSRQKRYPSKKYIHITGDNTKYPNILQNLFNIYLECSVDTTKDINVRQLQLVREIHGHV